MRHPDDGRLNDYADGLLAADAAAEVEAHLESCEACRARVDAVRDLTARLGALPREIAPRRDLSAGARQRVSGTRGEPPRRRVPVAGGRPGRGGHGSWLRAAVVAVLLLGAGTGVWLVLGSDGPPAPAADPVVGSYTRATAALTAALQERSGDLSPAAARALETNLAVVDAAIRELQRARASGADGRELSRQLEARYRTKLGLLRGALELLEES